MGFFSSKTHHTLRDGRTITFINKSSAQAITIQAITNAARSAAATSKIATTLPALTFILEDYLRSHFQSKGVACVYQKEVEQGLLAIHIAARDIEERAIANILRTHTINVPREELTKKQFKQKFFSNPDNTNAYLHDVTLLTKQKVIHECTHLAHYFHGILGSLKNILPRLTRHVQEHIPNDPAKWREHGIDQLRMLITHFFINIFAEGLARFIDREESGKIAFTHADFSYLYLLAEEKAKQVRDELNALLRQRTYELNAGIKAGDVQANQKAFINRLARWKEVSHTASYDIGLHAVHAILMTLQTPLRHLFTLSHLRFVATYEKAMQVYGESPIITLKNQSGILVYQDLLSTLTEFAHQHNLFKQT
ncbi:hypothetical protein D6783_04775 [Candidatus Woesearchaeota archaeon]|nr:MAG: hypothetical protein D6783_04775 [Candidatus Woesearchaeota archaeon]